MIVEQYLQFFFPKRLENKSVKVEVTTVTVGFFNSVLMIFMKSHNLLLMDLGRNGALLKTVISLIMSTVQLLHCKDCRFFMISVYSKG